MDHGPGNGNVKKPDFYNARHRARANVNDEQLAQFLGRRYGDGLVYMQEREDKVLLRLAMKLGLVSEEGYLTPSGYRFWNARVD